MDKCLRKVNSKQYYSIGSLTAVTATADLVLLAHGMATADYACGDNETGTSVIIAIDSKRLLPYCHQSAKWIERQIAKGAARKLDTQILVN